MKLFGKKYSTSLYLFVIVGIGAFLRFYKLDWGEGFFFHPDEYHIAAAVNRLSFPSQMNPKLFSYGSFTIYLVYFAKSLFFSKASPFLIGRFISATLSTLTIVITYLITKSVLKNKLSALTSALLVAIMPGLIQQAHFATPESNLTFLLMTTLYFWINWLKKSKPIIYFISAVTLGFAVGTKIVALVFLPVSMILPFLKQGLKRQKHKILRKFIYAVCLFLIFLLIASVSCFLVFPYSILDWKNFQSSMRYETGLGRGSLLVFYTRQFINTTPIFFQFQKILPFTLGPAVLVSGTLGFIFAAKEVFTKILKRKPSNYYLLLVVVFSFVVYFASNTLLFTKWTRFIAPSFPFFAIFTSYIIYKTSSLVKKKTAQQRIVLGLSAIIVLATSIWTLMFFSIYIHQDIRLKSTTWISKNLPVNSFILTESGNMLEAPLKGNYQKTSFDFYHLDENVSLQKQLPQLLFEADYFIIQSRRIFANHQRLPKQFPVTSRFYNLLFSNKLSFEKIKEFNSYPKLEISLRLGASGSERNWKLEIDDELAEETWSVFDHPVIRIYKKTKVLTIKDYENLLKI